MALNKLKLGTALSAQIAEQNDNLDEIEDRLTEGAKKVIYLTAPEGDLRAFVDTLTETKSIYILYIAANVTGLPTTAAFEYGFAQVVFRGNKPYVLLIGHAGALAMTSKITSGWTNWRVHSGVSE